MSRFLSLIVAIVFAAPLCRAQDHGVTGFWKEPGGSVIRIASCGSGLCATLAQLSPSAPSRVDGKNPDETQRKRPLCGLQIGQGFHLTTPDRAEGGTLYDPKSGKTYHGLMRSRDDVLDLRGYIGISLFGRSERWTRTAAPPACAS